MINLYSLHNNPEQLVGYEQARTRVPEVAWGLTRTNRQKKKFEHLWATDPKSAFLYARDVLESRWPLAEPVIAKDPYYAFLYADDILKSRWPLAEPVIAKDPHYAFLYALLVLKQPWPQGESAIAKNPEFAQKYERKFGVKLKT